MSLGFHLVIDGAPVPKARARTVKTRSGAVRTYTPAKTAAWERQVRQQVRMQIGGRDPVEGPVDLQLTFCLPIPESWPDWKREAAVAGMVVPTGKPDIDNLVKSVKDALNGLVWRDDAQVVSVSACKQYGRRPHVSVFVVCAGGVPACVRNRDQFMELA